MQPERPIAAARILRLDPFRPSGLAAVAAGRGAARRLDALGIDRGRVSTVPTTASRREAFDAADPLDDVLPRDDFLLQLRREIRRAERTEAPLSLICYGLSEATCDDPAQVDRLLEALYRCKREIDLVGHVGSCTLALLCPETTDAGCARLQRKVIAEAGDLSFEVDAATFPHALFDNLGEPSGRTSAERRLLVGEGRRPGTGHGYRLKRVLDVAGALAMLAVLWPLMLGVAAAIVLDSPGPILFRQQRLGLHGRSFWFLKFRSMLHGNDDGIHRAFVASLIKGGGPAAGPSNASAAYKLRDDPRLTRIGRWIRRTSIDELPQLFNVLRGDMSLVGPRPPIPYEAMQYRPWHLRRVLSMHPGITGLWQVEGRSRVSFDEMVRMDLRYSRDCSLALDVRLLLRTVAVVLRCDGAV